MRRVLLIFIIVLCAISLTMCRAVIIEDKEDVIKDQESYTVNTVESSEVEETATEVKTLEGSLQESSSLGDISEEVSLELYVKSFGYYPIDDKIKERIVGSSWKEGSPVTIDDLSYVEVAYWGFDDKPHKGELIVNKAVAQDIVEIFKELFEARFPIEKIRLIDEYEANDNKSMADNNTSSFCFREIDGKPGKLSKHSYGVAIDINPVQNPYVYMDKVSPEAGREYLDRSKVTKGMIVKDDVCYKAFINRGWTWGGDWKNEKDYQHFQKSLD